ncbi:meiosis protein mei2-like [Wolffia australiana]
MAPLNPHAPVFIPTMEFPPAMEPRSFSISFPQPYPLLQPLLQPLLPSFTVLSSVVQIAEKYPPLSSYCFPTVGVEFLRIPLLPRLPSVLPATPLFPPATLLPLCSFCDETDKVVQPGAKTSSDAETDVDLPRSFMARKRGVRIGPRWRMSTGRPTRRSFNPVLSSLWQPKLRCLRRKCSEANSLLDSLQIKIDANGDSRTTVMIRNLPNQLRKNALLSLLDSHCCQENMVAAPSEDVHSPPSQYDFFYLPIDFETGCNLGYAFVNFTSLEGARRLHRAFHYMKWGFLDSKKVCEVTYAKLQGLPDLLSHFRRSVFVCDDEELLPSFFVPHRDGAMKHEVRHVGQRVPKSGHASP